MASDETLVVVTVQREDQTAFRDKSAIVLFSGKAEYEHEQNGPSFISNRTKQEEVNENQSKETSRRRDTFDALDDNGQQADKLQQQQTGQHVQMRCRC